MRGKPPTIPPSYGPFAIQAIGSLIIVTYAKTQPGSDDEADGHGLGFVDAFTTSGRLAGKVAIRSDLNAPWGIALAPQGFGPFAGDLLVGNFGDGLVHVYRPIFGGLLWRRSGPDRNRTLYFSAGPNGENHGLFGTITPN